MTVPQIPPARLTWMPLIPIDQPAPRAQVPQATTLSGLDRFHAPPPLGALPYSGQLPEGRSYGQLVNEESLTARAERSAARVERSAVYHPSVVRERRSVVAPGTPEKLAQAVSPFNGLAWAGTLPANGNREAAVLVPKGTDLSKPVEVMIFFHGNGGNAANTAKWFRPYIEQLPQHGRNAIVVLPTAGAGNRSMDPKLGESLTALQDQAVAVAAQVAGRGIKAGSYTVDGFSGGGQPIAIAADAGQLRANHINLFDSTYGDWGDRAVKHRQPGATVNVFYTEHNRLRAERLRGIPGVTVDASPTSHGGTPVRFFYYYADGSIQNA